MPIWVMYVWPFWSRPNTEQLHPYLSPDSPTNFRDLPRLKHKDQITIQQVPQDPFAQRDVRTSRLLGPKHSSLQPDLQKCHSRHLDQAKPRLCPSIEPSTQHRDCDKYCRDTRTPTSLLKANRHHRHHHRLQAYTVSERECAQELHAFLHTSRYRSSHGPEIPDIIDSTTSGDLAAKAAETERG